VLLRRINGDVSQPCIRLILKIDAGLTALKEGKLDLEVGRNVENLQIRYLFVISDLNGI
jgi:hypothetical protein